MPPQAPKGQKRKSWPARHKVLTGLIAFGALVIVAVASASNKPSTKAGCGHWGGGQLRVSSPVSGSVIRRSQLGSEHGRCPV